MCTIMDFFVRIHLTEWYNRTTIWVGLSIYIDQTYPVAIRKSII